MVLHKHPLPHKHRLSAATLFCIVLIGRKCVESHVCHEAEIQNPLRNDTHSLRDQGIPSLPNVFLKIFYLFHLIYSSTVKTFLMLLQWIDLNYVRARN